MHFSKYLKKIVGYQSSPDFVKRVFVDEKAKKSVGGVARRLLSVSLVYHEISERSEQVVVSIRLKG